VVGKLAPPEGRRVGFLLIEKGVDGNVEFLNATMNATADLLVGQQRKDAFHPAQS
jgi:hypothetical protein